MATTGYLRRSWNALTSDEGWWKSICILSLISLIPIVGPIAVSGYCFRWAREAAWGIEEPLPRGKGDLGAAIKSGGFVFLGDRGHEQGVLVVQEYKERIIRGGAQPFGAPLIIEGPASLLQDATGRL